tara:strand:- start:72 stop:956 length:885 start_codon:yes stop_codon:yes gene_type:complete
MDSSCSQYLNLKKLSHIEYRIKYYLGLLYYEDRVYVDNLIGIEDCQSNDLKNILVKYRFQDKKFIYSNHDIQGNITTYTLVRNRWMNTINNSIILLNIGGFVHCWNKFYYDQKDNIKFENKINSVFWRGSTTGHNNRPGNRFTLVTNYFNKYKDIDVGFSHIVQGKINYKKYVKGGAKLSQFYKYKYLLSIPGNSEAGGLNWKLASNSLVLMPKPYAFSWLMEDMLIPNYHYILLKDDFSNLREKLDWCNSHPKEVKQIIKNANKYMEMFRNIKEQEHIEYKVLELYFKKVKST